MKTLTAHVENGRLVMDEPTLFPEGTQISLVVADPGDEIEEQERAALHQALLDAWMNVQAGRLKAGEELIARLRKR